MNKYFATIAERLENNILYNNPHVTSVYNIVQEKTMLILPTDQQEVILVYTVKQISEIIILKLFNTYLADVPIIKDAKNTLVI